MPDGNKSTAEKLITHECMHVLYGLVDALLLKIQAQDWYEVDEVLENLKAALEFSEQCAKNLAHLETLVNSHPNMMCDAEINQESGDSNA